MTILKNGHFQGILIVLIVAALVTLIIMLSYSYFNLTEINTLVDDADKRNLEYELIIHNNLTNSYTFNIVEQ
ncbi:hypothetical protein GCM10007358_04860 [Phocicoccus schoeneichii]|uniref:Uncharacterized protein n=1 Tax=Phocicoccus schoeneichii TaxID=1812261 RepID=A0A6V7RGZ4_9BACL|nr:hypothetical protein GCM10007358_04860 [Jeotgalicoccus schoeneichii]CAD2076395.1 hypothetical protein JEOSCH030_01065 [Jeotgalicoccus schoeneichii]